MLGAQTPGAAAAAFASRCAPAAACTMSAAVRGPPLEQQDVSRSMAPFRRKICGVAEVPALDKGELRR